MAAHLPRPWSGITAPLVTPLHARDELDHEGLARLIERLVSGGISALFILGTTGEGPSLAYKLRQELIERTCELTAGRLPVLVAVTDTSLTEALGLAEFARECGAAAAVAAPPYYFPPTEAELALYFERLLDAAPLPVVLYNMPSCTKAPLSPALLAKLAGHENAIGLKDSGGDLNYFRRALALRDARPDWTFLVGPEHLLVEATVAGGDGGVHGGALVDPALYVELHSAARRGAWGEVERLDERRQSLARLYRVAGNVSAVTRGLKAALSRLGVCDDVLAEPLTPLTNDERRLAAAIVAELGLEPLDTAAAR